MAKSKWYKEKELEAYRRRLVPPNYICTRDLHVTPLWHVRYSFICKTRSFDVDRDFSSIFFSFHIIMSKDFIT
jgi:hypothetical protein